MGCFSFMCKECGKPVLSNSFTGQRVKLFLLKEGEVVQEMEGEYDSYGRVFVDNTQRSDVQHELRESTEWGNPFPEKPPTENELYFMKNGEPLDTWGRVCDLMFSGDSRNGIAAVHTKCFTGKVPTTKSDDDPNQGWGEEWEYFADTDPETEIE